MMQQHPQAANHQNGARCRELNFTKPELVSFFGETRSIFRVSSRTYNLHSDTSSNRYYIVEYATYYPPNKFTQIPKSRGPYQSAGDTWIPRAIIWGKRVSECTQMVSGDKIVKSNLGSPKFMSICLKSTLATFFKDCHYHIYYLKIHQKHQKNKLNLYKIVICKQVVNKKQVFGQAQMKTPIDLRRSYIHRWSDGFKIVSHLPKKHRGGTGDAHQP